VYNINRNIMNKMESIKFGGVSLTIRRYAFVF
jgi:hypothetical protein